MFDQHAAITPADPAQNFDALCRQLARGAGRGARREPTPVGPMVSRAHYRAVANCALIAASVFS